MKGVIFNTVEEAVVDLGGEDLWDDLLDAAGVSGSYTALGNYPDEELVAIVGAASDALGLPVPEVLVTVGRAVLPHLAGRVPELVAQVDTAQEFLSSVHEVIHVEVKKLYPDAKPPDLAYQFLDNGGLELSYKSGRHLEDLAEGLLLGTGDLFEQPLSVSRRQGPDDTVIFTVENA